MAKIFKKPTNKFIVLLRNQAKLTDQGLEALITYLEDHSEEAAANLRTKEKEADEVRRILIDELNRTFITPFDREDIFKLSRAIDDVLDYAYSTVNEMSVLDVVPTPYMLRMASLLKDAAFELLMAMNRLEDNKGVATEHAQRAKALENRVERVYREALAELFSQAESIEDIVSILKNREVYRHLSNAADQGDEAANVIADIVVKLT